MIKSLTLKIVPYDYDPDQSDDDGTEATPAKMKFEKQ